MQKLGTWVVVTGLAMVGEGCASVPGRTLVNVLPPEHKGLAVFVAPPKLNLTDPECREEVVAKLGAGGLTGPMRQALISGGYRVVTGAESADVVMTVATAVADCWESDGSPKGGFVEPVSVAVEAHGDVVFEGVKPHYVCNVDAFGGGCVANWPADFTNDLTNAVAAAGMRPGGRASGGSPPVAANTPTAAQPVAPPTAASPPVAPPAAGPILTAGQPRPNAYALVVGIEKYRGLPAPPGARADAQNFAELAKKTLGVPSDHVILALDEFAGKADIEKHLAWLKLNVPAGGRVYFFFAGHGAPDTASQGAYLMPHDGDPAFASTTGLSVNHVLSQLGATSAQDAIAFVDACYSGAGGRSVLPTGARALVRVVEPKVDAAPRVALFSSAGASEISGPAPGGTEGLFTHTLVEAFGSAQADQDGDGNISLGEIHSWVKPRVSREAKKSNRDQNPTLTVGKAAGDPGGLILAAGVAR